jgi:hypothetical protein
MSFTTFSGPVRAGTVRENVGRNCGLPVLTQSYTALPAVIKASPTAQLLCTLPAGSKILRMQVEVTVAMTGATNCGLVVGTSGTSNAYFTTFNTGATVGMVTQATVDSAMQVASTNNIGTSDVGVYGTFTAATADATAGNVVVTIEYIQRAPDGSQNPVNS